MNLVETSRLADILDQVKGWSPESRIVLARRMLSRIVLARRILETLEPVTAPPPAQAVRSVHELIGMGAGGSPPPDDETVRRWIDEHRSEKYR
jgi:hypothetical protein